MKKKFESPNIDIILFDATDVICTSSVQGEVGSGNTTSSNAGSVDFEHLAAAGS